MITLNELMTGMILRFVLNIQHVSECPIFFMMRTKHTIYVTIVVTVSYEVVDLKSFDMYILFP